MLPGMFMRVGLLVPAGGAEFRVEGELIGGSGNVLLSYTSSYTHRASGLHLLTAGELGVSSFTYGAGEVANAIRLNQRLPEGRYEHCIRVISLPGEEDDTYCEVEDVDAFAFLDLVYPWDGDTLDDQRPTLNWTMSASPGALVGSRVRLVLVDRSPGMSAAAALANNPPRFLLSDVQSFVVPYPAGLPELVRGDCYAWQVERERDGLVVDRSEQWFFCISQVPVFDQRKYVVLDGDDTRVIHDLVDGRLFLMYEEPYDAEAIAVHIRAVEEAEVMGAVRVDVPADTSMSAHAKRIGFNRYELDLSTVGLAPGTHVLLVADEKGRISRLTIRLNN